MFHNYIFATELHGDIATLLKCLSVRLPIIMYKKKRVCITHDVCLLIMKKYEVCTRAHVM